MEFPNECAAVLGYTGQQDLCLVGSGRPQGVSGGQPFFQRPDLQPDGELIACEQKSRSVTRTDKSGEIHDVATHYQGKRLNSPNDVIAAEDGSILFTDPIYGSAGGHGRSGRSGAGFPGSLYFPSRLRPHKAGIDHRQL